jgi:hypothetical protein
MESAIVEGTLDDLPGKGHPLKLYVNPFADRDWQLAFGNLAAAIFAPPWIELDCEIRER